MPNDSDTGRRNAELLKTVMEAQAALKRAIEALPEDLRETLNEGYFDDQLDEQAAEAAKLHTSLTRNADSIYTMRHRPCTQVGMLPQGVITKWHRIPRDLSDAFPDKAVSDKPFGEFTTSRPLTDRELEDYEIDQIG